MLRVGVHLHDQILRLPPSLVTQPGLLVQADGRECVEEARQASHSVGPAEIVEVGIHEPVAPRVGPPENDHGEEHENGWKSMLKFENVWKKIKLLTCSGDTNKIDGREDPFVLQDKLQGPSAQLQGHDDLRPETQQERHGYERLHCHQPRGQQPLSNDVVLLAEDVVASVKVVVELVVGVAEVIEAVLPQPHIFEFGKCFFERFQPVRAAECYHE